MPSPATDADAKRLGVEVDLSNYNLSGFKPVRYEFEPQAAALHMRLLQNLLDALKLKASAKGMPFTRYVRLLMENTVSRWIFMLFLACSRIYTGVSSY